MKIRANDSIAIPANVKVSVKNRVVTVVGPRGTLVKDLSHLVMDFRVQDNGAKLNFVRWFGRRLDLACIKTGLSIVKNMVTGVVRGFRYKMRAAYAHFPINITTEGQFVEIRNFLGEKRVRILEVPAGITVSKTDVTKVKDELVIEGSDLCVVSQEAAKIHQLCLVKNKDIRMFLDGIYVQTKEHCDSQ
jgi:large subunit ribosomal protein L9e